MTWPPVPASTPDASDWWPPLNARFRHYVFLDFEDVPFIVELLASPRDGVPNGSSFIVDANAPSGQRRIWLSEASLAALNRFKENRA